MNALAAPVAPRVYLDKAEAARAIGVHEQALYSIEREGNWIDPDIIIGMQLDPKGRRFTGYAEERVIAYGKATRRLDEDGNVRPLGGQQRFVLRQVPQVDGKLPEWFHTTTRLYLSRTDLAALWGLKVRSVAMRAQRGSLPAPAVAVNVSMNRGPTLGYDPERIRRESEQYGMTMTVDLRKHPTVLHNEPAA